MPYHSSASLQHCHPPPSPNSRSLSQCSVIPQHPLHQFAALATYERRETNQRPPTSSPVNSSSRSVPHPNDAWPFSYVARPPTSHARFEHSSVPPSQIREPSNYGSNRSVSGGSLNGEINLLAEVALADARGKTMTSRSRTTQNPFQTPTQERVTEAPGQSPSHLNHQVERPARAAECPAGGKVYRFGEVSMGKFVEDAADQSRKVNPGILRYCMAVKSCISTPTTDTTPLRESTGQLPKAIANHPLIGLLNNYDHQPQQTTGQLQTPSSTVVLPPNARNNHPLQSPFADAARPSFESPIAASPTRSLNCEAIRSTGPVVESLQIRKSLPLSRSACHTPDSSNVRPSAILDFQSGRMPSSTHVVGSLPTPISGTDLLPAEWPNHLEDAEGFTKIGHWTDREHFSSPNSKASEAPESHDDSLISAGKNGDPDHVTAIHQLDQQDGIRSEDDHPRNRICMNSDTVSKSASVDLDNCHSKLVGRSCSQVTLTSSPIISIDRETRSAKRRLVKSEGDEDDADQGPSKRVREGDSNRRAGESAAQKEYRTKKKGNTQQVSTGKSEVPDEAEQQSAFRERGTWLTSARSWRGYRISLSGASWRGRL